MPTRERLPGDLKALAFRSAFSLHNEHWRSDVEEMARRLKLPDDKTATGWTAALGQLLNAPVEGRYEIEASINHVARAYHWVCRNTCRVCVDLFGQAGADN